jgi:methylated-DNA-[protein]-cysteine S-methyltransferase
MPQINIQYHKTRIGEFILGSFNGQLCLMDYRYRKIRKTIDDRIKTGLNAEFVEQDDEVLAETRKQIDEYLAKERKEFELPLLTVGTDFQKAVWQELLKIPYGQTSAYFDLARKLSSEKAVRAVASANGANAISIIIPCHRVIGSNGELTGYAGGIDVKKKLLIMEKEDMPFMEFGQA